jgi:hypothetical protein
MLRSPNRVAIAFAIAPLATGAVFALVTWLSDPGLIRQNGIAAYIGFYSVFGYAATVLFGLPSWWLWRKMRWTSYEMATGVGATIGLATGLLLKLSILQWGDTALILPSCTLAGALSALLFRAIGGKTV